VLLEIADKRASQAPTAPAVVATEGEAADTSQENGQEAATTATEASHPDIFAALKAALKEDEAPAEEKDSAEAGEAGAALPSGGVVVTTGPDWKTEFGELFAKKKGARRLRKEKPHTGEIGSWGLKQAAEDLTLQRGCDALSVHTLLGRKSNLKVEVQMEKADDAEAIEKQWGVLKAAFGKPHSVLLFHLTNHYALIFAWREWHEEDAEIAGAQKVRRQILTARKGQRPTVWMDWEEARSIMLGWSGYHILQFQRRPGSAQPAPQHAELGA